MQPHRLKGCEHGLQDLLKPDACALHDLAVYALQSCNVVLQCSSFGTPVLSCATSLACPILVVHVALVANVARFEHAREGSTGCFFCSAG